MHIEYNKVTWYSKFLAVVVFLATFAIAFFLGYQYSEVQNIAKAPFLLSSVSGTSDSPRNEETSVKPVNNNLTLAVGQNGAMGNFRIKFNSLVQDSRCPVDVQCIQAGAVTVNVTFAQGPHTESRNMPSDEVPLIFEDYRISIVGVGPPRKSTQEIEPQEYKVTFKIEHIQK